MELIRIKYTTLLIRSNNHILIRRNILNNYLRIITSYLEEITALKDH